MEEEKKEVKAIEKVTEEVDKICQIFEEAQTTYGEITVKLQYTDALNDVSDYIV